MTKRKQSSNRKQSSQRTQKVHRIASYQFSSGGVGKPSQGKSTSPIPDAFRNKRGMVTEREMKLAQRRMNDGKISPSSLWNEDGWKLTQEQNQKGKTWLTKLQRKRESPFGYREDAIINDFKEIRLVGFHRHNQAVFYYPVYDVYANNGNSFQYYMALGEIHIVG